VPWGEFDVLFLGGTTAWKLGPAARDLTAQAVGRGVPVHMGRVNSRRRLHYAHTIGCSSADGTYLTFGPDTNLPKLLGWLADLDTTVTRRAPTRLRYERLRPPDRPNPENERHANGRYSIPRDARRRADPAAIHGGTWT
jgi:hypothetical protein